MSPVRSIAFILIVFITVSVSNAQIRTGSSFGGKRKQRGQKTPWVFGIGWNAVDDNGSPFKKLFDFGKSWCMRAYPTQLSAELPIIKGWTAGSALSFNVIKPGKIINGKDNPKTFLFFALDGNLKYHLNEHIKMPYWCDMYASVGGGYTLRITHPYMNTLTLNLGTGFNFWVRPWIGVNIQSLAKFGLRTPFITTGSNYLQHSIGFIVRPSYYGKRTGPFIKARYPWVHKKRKGYERL